ncbi:RNA pseudouridine synthase [Treponema sp. OMZ 305]|uniref:pseudouridine synthase n=1 Tax=Treponema sp. OMZ 305 TaxID=1659192 RepID=UPI0020A5B6DB|nr:pseudouridine synthase [Treponema sp. OMZ 305]UTC58219.1 RNA pseudouridine synthase [Treponema sp. OMZ 305]
MCAEESALQNSTDICSICSVTAAFDYTRTAPCIVRETAHWAIVYKPPHLPTAPLWADERNTLVYWFLHRAKAKGNAPSDDNQTDALVNAAQNDVQVPLAEVQVRGKKAIEAGLLHRLDTDTRGLVLFAKDQAVYDFLAARQEAGRMIKTYCAFVEPTLSPEIDNGHGFDVTELSALKELSVAQRRMAVQEQIAAQERIAAKLPLTLESQFRNFGPGAKRVAPVFSASRHYKKDGRLYTTVIEAVDMLPSSIGGNDTVAQIACESCPSQTGAERRLIRVRCRLSRGYRHQVRAHLAAAGLPIVGDPLYAPQGAEAAHKAENTGVSLQLYAVSLEFPDPENPQRNILVALPPPDKMNP